MPSLEEFTFFELGSEGRCSKVIEPLAEVERVRHYLGTNPSIVRKGFFYSGFRQCCFDA